jgi:hypothetical protein
MRCRLSRLVEEAGLISRWLVGYWHCHKTVQPVRMYSFGL